MNASINLIPLSLFRKLGLREEKPTYVTVLMADHLLKRSTRVIKYVIIKVDKLILLIDFIVLDPEEDKDILIMFHFLSLEEH